MGFRRIPKPGKWHHIAVTFDGVIERVYVDGKLNNEAAKMLLMHQGRPMYIGASEPGTEHLSGSIAWLKVWPHAKAPRYFDSHKSENAMTTARKALPVSTIRIAVVIQVMLFVIDCHSRCSGAEQATAASERIVVVQQRLRLVPAEHSLL